MCRLCAPQLRDTTEVSEPMTSTEVVIIGGGISGTAAAYELARVGVRVVLVEKGALASMASGWTLAGVRQSGRHPAELPLAQAAVRRWMTLDAELDAETEYRQEGNLRLARTPDEVPVIAAMAREQRARGLDLTFLPDNAAVRAVAPAIADTVLAASFCPTDGHANPTRTVRAFAAAAERHGATILTETAVTGIDTAGGAVRGIETTRGPIAADVVINVAGVYADRICRMVGLDLPITTAHVAAIQTVPGPSLIAPVIGVANADFAGRQEVSGAFRMTGGSGPWQWPIGPLAAEDVQPPIHAVAPVLERGCAILPALRAMRIARLWGGLLDMTPDGLPVIEVTPVTGFIVAAGFSGHGFCLGPVTGQMLCELATRGAASLPLEPFRLARFAGMHARVAPTLHG